MLRRTQRNIIYGFGAIIVIVLIYSLYFVFTKPIYVDSKNALIKDVAFYMTNEKPGSRHNVLFSISWKQKLKKSSAENKNYFYVEQVVQKGKNWVPVENGKKCTIDFIQYVYAPWVDSEEKRAKADPDKRDDKVTQLFVNINPKEEIDDYYRVVAKNIETSEGQKIITEEYGVININDFNKFIKR